jgi:hypothetical protein
MRKQNRRSSDAWVQPSAVKEIVAKREPLAFLSDEEITSSWVFKITQWFWLTYAAILHGIDAPPRRISESRCDRPPLPKPAAPQNTRWNKPLSHKPLTADNRPTWTRPYMYRRGEITQR